MDSASTGVVLAGLLIGTSGAPPAPLLSSPADIATSDTTGSGTVSATVGTGTLYWYVKTNCTPPSAATLKAGTSSVDFGSQAVSATGTQSISTFDGLTASTFYCAHYIQTTAAPIDTAIVSADGFTTSAGGGSVAVADQNISFGALTKVNAGGAVPYASTGSITSASETSDSAGYFTVNTTTGEITPNQTADDANFSACPCTVGMSFNAGADTATITIPAEIANTYTVKPAGLGSTSGWGDVTQTTTAVAAFGDTGGATLAYRPGTETIPSDEWYLNRHGGVNWNFASDVVLTSTDPTVIEVRGQTHGTTTIDGIASTTGILRGMRVRGISVLAETFVTAVAANSVTLSQATRFDWPDEASYICSGSCQASTVPHTGTPILFSNRVNFTNADSCVNSNFRSMRKTKFYQIDLEALLDDDTNCTNTNRAFTMTGANQWTIEQVNIWGHGTDYTIEETATLNNYQGGFISNDGTTYAYGPVIFKDNRIDGGGGRYVNLVRDTCTEATGSLLVENNLMLNTGSDDINIGGRQCDATIRYNDIGPAWLSASSGDHVDFMQLNPESFNDSDLYWYLNRMSELRDDVALAADLDDNRYFVATQGPFMQGSISGDDTLINSTICCNLIYMVGSHVGVTSDGGAKDNVDVIANVAVSYAADSMTGALPAGSMELTNIYGSVMPSNSTVRDNVAYGITITAGGSGNTNTNNSGSTAYSVVGANAYSNLFNGTGCTDWKAYDFASMVTCFSMKTAGPLDQTVDIGHGAYVDWDGLAPTPGRTPTFSSPTITVP